jgi:hypothetical protein
MPRWFAEGLAQFLETVRARRGREDRGRRLGGQPTTLSRRTLLILRLLDFFGNLALRHARAERGRPVLHACRAISALCGIYVCLVSTVLGLEPECDEWCQIWRCTRNAQRR